MPEDLRALIDNLKIKILVNTSLYNDNGGALVNVSQFDIGYHGEDSEYELVIHMCAAYGQSASVPFLVLTGNQSETIPRFEERFNLLD